jgi:hypothetical protein
MNNFTEKQTHSPELALDGNLIQACLRTVWQMIRLPVVFLLVILEPAVDMVFGSLALLGVLMALFFKACGIPVGFHFITMIAVSVCFGLTPCAYRALLWLFAK